MEISLESIQEVEDPYQAFVDSIKNSGTFSRYRNPLGQVRVMPTIQPKLKTGMM